MTTQRPKNENEVLVDDHAQRKESIKEEDQNNVSNESPKFFNDPWAWGSSIPILTDNTYCGNSNPKAIRGTIEEVAEMMKAERRNASNNSKGNGSAMRVNPVGFAFNNLDNVLEEAKRSAAERCLP